MGFGWLGLAWVGARQHGLDWSWVGLEPHYIQTWKHTASVGFRWVWLELGWVGLEPRSLVTTEHHPSVVLTAADVFIFLIKNAHEVTGDTQPFGHTLVHTVSGN